MVRYESSAPCPAPADHFRELLSVLMTDRTNRFYLANGLRSTGPTHSLKELHWNLSFHKLTRVPKPSPFPLCPPSAFGLEYRRPHQAGGRKAQVVLRGDPWTSESISPGAQQNWGLLLVKVSLLAWATAQTARRLGQGSSQPILAPVPWVSHFAQNRNPKVAGENTSHCPAKKATGRGRNMKNLEVSQFGWGDRSSWF